MACTFKSFSGDKDIILSECPFCGGEPELIHIGDDYIKIRTIEIRCKSCRCKRTNTALHGFDWLEDVSVKAWNQRPGNNGGAL